MCIEVRNRDRTEANSICAHKQNRRDTAVNQIMRQTRGAFWICFQFNFAQIESAQICLKKHLIDSTRFLVWNPLFIVSIRYTKLICMIRFPTYGEANLTVPEAGTLWIATKELDRSHAERPPSLKHCHHWGKPPQSVFQCVVKPPSRSSFPRYSSRAYMAIVPVTLIHLQTLPPVSPP